MKKNPPGWPTYLHGLVQVHSPELGLLRLTLQIVYHRYFICFLCHRHFSLKKILLKNLRGKKNETHKTTTGGSWNGCVCMYPPLSFFLSFFLPIQLITKMGSLYFCHTTPSCICTCPLGSRWTLLFLTGTGFYNRNNKLRVNIFKETDNVILQSPTGFVVS